MGAGCMHVCPGSMVVVYTVRVRGGPAVQSVGLVITSLCFRILRLSLSTEFWS